MTKKKDEKVKTILDELKTDKDGKYIYPLLKSIKQGSEVITEFRLDEPRAKHIRNMPANPTTGDSLDIIADLAAQAPSVIDELSLKDLTRLSEFVELFS